MERAEELTGQLYKAHFGKMVASLLYASRDIDPESAEDIVQDSFSAALVDWTTNGIPDNPGGWLYKVCRNKALNWIKREKKLTSFSNERDIASVETKFSESVLGDHQLQLLFACANPGLAPKVQIVITLKYVVNLRVEAIARVLAMSVDGVDKLLMRARQKIRDEKILLEEPAPSLLLARLPVVHKILYLIFNEGYKASWGKEMIREELCEEALIMCRTLAGSSVKNKETLALYALMLFNSARFDSRFGAAGELLDLEHQDRSKWNGELIALGNHYLKESEDEKISSYHLEAAIAYFHCAAPVFAETKWNSIANLYVQLLRDNPNPFAELSYAIALYYSGKNGAALEILENLRKHAFLSQYSLLNAALGKLHGLEGRKELARKYFFLAQKQTIFEKEKKFIESRIESLGKTE